MLAHKSNMVQFGLIVYFLLYIFQLFKRSSIVLYGIVPHLLLPGSIPFIFTTAKTWESEFKLIDQGCPNLL